LEKDKQLIIDGDIYPLQGEPLVATTKDLHACAQALFTIKLSKQTTGLDQQAA
jgi:hypothetical protein